jgi:hypothetical protein
VFAEDAHGQFALTPPAALLQRARPGHGTFRPSAHSSGGVP